MGNCCLSSSGGGQSAIGGSSSHPDANNAPNDAVEGFLKSRGYHGLYTQIEVYFQLFSLFHITSFKLMYACNSLCNLYVLSLYVVYLLEYVTLLYCLRLV